MRIKSFTGIGIDIIEIKRFTQMNGPKGGRFFANVYTKREQQYCRKFANPVPHFAGTFAAKEAASKALGGKYLFTVFEVRRTKSGKPEIWKNGTRLSDLSISISHAESCAVAVCVAA